MAAALPLEEFDENFLTCPICEELFDDPRVLPCIHTFCAKCLEKWRKGENQFTCPTCRHQVTLQGADVRSLPPNFYINNLLDFRALHDSEEAHTKCQMCKSDGKVEGRCADCRFFLCMGCVSIHSNIPALKDHYILTLHGLKDPSSRSKYSRAEYCPEHTDQRMTFYCQPCAKLVCRDCTITEHRPGPDHNPQEVRKVAQKFKTDLQTLVGKSQDTAEAMKRTAECVSKELTSITANCQTVRKEIRQHFAEMRAKLDREEKKVTDTLDMMEKNQKEPLLKEEKELKETLKTTEDELKVCTDILARDNDVETLTLRQQLEGKLKAISSSQVLHEALKHDISFQRDPMCNDLVKCYLFLTNEALFVTEAPVESLTTTVVFKPLGDKVWQTNPQVIVASPGGYCTSLDTTRTCGGVFEAVWRPQMSGKHIVAAMEREGATGRQTMTASPGSLCPPLIVDVGSNNHVLRFGQKGSQQGQFDTPIDVAVRGDRLYVADTGNRRVQVFDLSGNFCSSFLTTTNPGSVAVQNNGFVLVKSADEVVKFLPSGELLHKFPLGEHCLNSYGVAVLRDGRAVVADIGKHSILLFNPDGTLVNQVGGQGQGEGQFNCPCFVCVDGENSIIVSDKGNNRVQVFDKNLTFQYKFGQWGKRPQDIWAPHGVSVDSRGNIVLANVGGQNDDTGYSRKVQVFRPDGTWMSTISSDGDKLSLPCGVAVTEDGHVFVADASDHCIRKYRYM